VAATVQIAKDVVDDWTTYAQKMASRWGAVFGPATEETIKIFKTQREAQDDLEQQTGATTQKIVDFYNAASFAGMEYVSMVDDLPGPLALLAERLTVKFPAAVGVPEINPVAVLTLNPVGSPVA